MKSINNIIILIMILFSVNCNLSDTESEQTGINLFEKEKKIIKGTYTPIDSSGNYIIAEKENLYGLINSKKQIILAFEYELITHPNSKHYYFISKNNLFGVVDYNGNLIIPFEYEKIARTWNYGNTDKEMFIVQKNKKLGTIDDKNNTVIPFEYDGITDWVEDGPALHYVMKENYYGMIAYNGEIIIPVIYDRIHHYKHDCIKVKKDNKYGIVNWKNEIVIPIIYDSLMLEYNSYSTDNNSQNNLIVKKDNEWTYLSSNGEVINKNMSSEELKNGSFSLDYNDYDFSYIDSCMIFGKNNSF